MPTPIRPTDMEAYLDEALPVEEMAHIEKSLREDASLAGRLAEVIARRDAGVVSLGEVWRRHRLSCPTRQELGNFLLGVLPAEAAAYVTFHVEAVGCSYCQANLSDLANQQSEARTIADNRRKRYFQSSAGELRRGREA